MTARRGGGRGTRRGGAPARRRGSRRRRRGRRGWSGRRTASAGRRGGRRLDGAAGQDRRDPARHAAGGGEALAQGDAQAVLIDRGGERGAGPLLGGHVAGRAGDRGRLAVVVAVGGGELVGEAEVEDA